MTHILDCEVHGEGNISSLRLLQSDPTADLLACVQALTGSCFCTDGRTPASSGQTNSPTSPNITGTPTLG